ncbi:MAG: zinc finger domain-containing protein [Vulcanimicrobiaceae bacterium]
MHDMERDARIIAAVLCPYCKAKTGDACRLDDGRSRSMPHSERLEAWRREHVEPFNGARRRNKREVRITDAVACPFCEVAKGVWCVRYPGSSIDIPGVHPERREASREGRPPEPPENPAVYCACGHAGGTHYKSAGPNYPDAPKGCKKCACQRSANDVRGQQGHVDVR